MAAPILLVDGSGYIFRAFHALPMLNRSDGLPTNAVRGFMSMLLKLMDSVPDSPIVVLFDARGNTFRNDIYPQYKANRSAPPEELVPQFALVREATRALNLPCIELVGYEADDLIATYAAQARAANLPAEIVSSDKDLMQLVAPGVTMLDPMKNRKIGPDEVVEKFGVGPDKVVDVQSLAGDSVDNVPGVPGIGIKTAAELINNYGDLDSLLSRAEEIKQPKRRENLIEFADQARVSRDLVRLKGDVDLEEGIASFKRADPDQDKLSDFLEEMEFRSIAQRLGLEIAVGGDSGAVVDDEPPLKEAKYEAVTTLAQLDALIAAAKQARVIGFDTETTSLDATQAELVGLSIATEPGNAVYVPLAHKKGDGLDLDGLDLDGQAIEQIPLQDALDRLKPLLIDPAVLKVGHNIKYDALVLKSYGVDVEPVDDTMVLSYVLEAGLHSHGLDALASSMLEHQCTKFTDVVGTGKKQITFDQVPIDKATHYAAEDADVTLRLHKRLKPRIGKEQAAALYERIERPLIPVLCEMESHGIKVDRDHLRSLSNNFAQRSAKLEEQIYGLAGESFTIGSPKQLGDILFNKLGLPGSKKGKSGTYSTDASVLDGLAAQGHELPTKIVEWRQVNKLKSTYTDALQNQINPKTGRVHTSYGMAIASTGRLSSTDPNLQNIPVRTEDGRQIREAFIAEPGNVLLSVDYSQIELRITAHVADETGLKAAFHNGADIHAATASEMFGVPIAGMDPMVRRQAKAINFGIIYGISPFGLANNLGIPQGEAKGFISAYFERFPGIKDYMAKARQTCKDQGYVETLFGRKIHLPGIKERIPAKRGFAERQAINAPIQGTAADIIKRAMIRMGPALEEANLSARMLLQVHDELLFEVPEEELERTTEVAREIMEAAALPVVALSVPIVADAGHGANWAQAH